MKRNFKRRTIIEIRETYNAKGLFYNYYIYHINFYKRKYKIYGLSSLHQLSKGKLLYGKISKSNH